MSLPTPERALLQARARHGHGFLRRVANPEHLSWSTFARSSPRADTNSPERWRRGGGSPPPSLGVAGTTFGTETGWRAAQPATARTSDRRRHDAEYQCGVNTWFHARPLSMFPFSKGR